MNGKLISQLIGADDHEYIKQYEKPARHYDVFLDKPIDEPDRYRELISILFNSQENDTINIFINSNGGHLDTALAIVEGLKQTNASTTAILIGACHSAASIISMYCHNVCVLESAYSMIHTASFGAQGNTSNVKSHTEFTVKQVEKLLNETYEGFLTKDELNKVKSGVELWFDSGEIGKRIQTRTKLLQGRQKRATTNTQVTS